MRMGAPAEEGGGVLLLVRLDEGVEVGDEGHFATVVRLGAAGDGRRKSPLPESVGYTACAHDRPGAARRADGARILGQGFVVLGGFPDEV